MTGFSTPKFGRVTYDYGQEKYFLEFVRQENSLWVPEQIVCVTQAIADENRRVISVGTGIPEKNIIGIILPMHRDLPQSLAFLDPKTI
jgi:hypothetical protein